MSDSNITRQTGEPKPPRAERKRRPRKGRFEIGTVLGSSFKIWGRNILPFSLLALLTFAPYGVFLFWSESLSAEAEWSQHLDLLLNTFLGTLLAAAVTAAVFAELRRRRLPLVQTVGSGLARIVPALAVALVLALIDAALSFAGNLIGHEVGPMIFRIVATVIACGFLVAIPAAVVERPGVFGALSRSWQLTNGNKAKIFVILLLFGLILGIGIVALAGLFVVSSGKDVDGENLPWWIQYLWVALLSTFSAVLSAVVYHDLRIAVEGVDSEQIVSVFD